MFSYWHKQTKEAPLYPDLEWDRPERKDQAGSLLIIGGSTHHLTSVNEAYLSAEAQGIGMLRLLIPENLRKITRHMPDVAYAPINPNGSFAAEAFEPMLFAATACDGTLLVGDMGRNSETAITLAQIMRTYSGPLAITKDAVDALYSEATYMLQREKTLLIVAEGQLQRLIREIKSPYVITSSMDIALYVERIAELSKQIAACLITCHKDFFCVALNGQVSTTVLDEPADTWRVKAAARAIVSYLHHRDKPFEAITTSLLHLFD